jgi:RHS repeat-associated protein
VIAAIASDDTITVKSSVEVDVIFDVTGWQVPAVSIWTYGYDMDGLRTKKTGPLASTSYTWDVGSDLPLLLAETSAGTTTRYVYGPGGLPVEDVTTVGGVDTVRYYHHDQLGSTRMLTDVNGDKLASFTYDAFGNLGARTDTATTPFGYAGQYTDAETGFQYLRARYYDPKTGQFLSRDPLVEMTGQPYAYAANSPLNGTDPSGEIAVVVIAGGVILAGLLLGVVAEQASDDGDALRACWESFWDARNSLIDHIYGGFRVRCRRPWPRTRTHSGNTPGRIRASSRTPSEAEQEHGRDLEEGSLSQGSLGGI